MHKTLALTGAQTIQDLLLARRTKRHYTQHLRLTTRKDG